MSEYTDVGMDVHARSVACKALEMEIEANARLKKEYDVLKGAGKHADVAKVAVVSEFVRWMWALGLQVQREQAA